MATAPTPQPGLLDQVKGTGNAILDMLKSRYARGPVNAPLTAGPGSVLDQHDAQLQPLLPAQAPLVPVHIQAPTAPVDRVNPQAHYGDRGQERRIDTSEMTKPLFGSGLSGIRRAKEGK